MSCCSCSSDIDSEDKYCRYCGAKNIYVNYALILMCDCAGNDLDRAKTCMSCGANRFCMTKEEFNAYCERIGEEYKEISRKASKLGFKNGALKRLKWNLEHPSGPKCTCSATSICGTHD